MDNTTAPKKNNGIFKKIKNAVSTAVKSVTADSDGDDHGVSAMLDRYWTTSMSARSELDWKWFQYDLWYNGNHYARWDKNTQQIISVNPRMDGRPKVTINKVYSTLRGVRSFVLQNSPKAEVTPFDMKEENVDQAMYLNRLLDYLHDHLHLRTSLRATMLHALKYSVGWWQVMWDDSAENGDGAIIVNVVDPYDLYIDPVARLPKEARYMILAVRRSIDELRSDPKYKDADWDTIVGTDTLAASTLKSRIMSYERGQYTFNDGEKEHGSVILKEYWYKDVDEQEEEVDDEENPGKTKKVTTKKPRIMIAAKVGEQMVRQPEDTGLDRLPFFRLASDVEPLSMYGQGWCKNLIPLNRMLETNEGSAMEYNVVVNKGRYKMTKNAGIKTVTNQHGIFVEHKVGTELEPLEIPQLSSELSNQIMRTNQYIEDIGCQHDASRGQGTPDATSGRAIEALQEGDSNNLSELMENTEEFLEDVYEYMLYILSQKLVFARNIVTSTETGEKMFFSIIGEGADEDLKAENDSSQEESTDTQNEQTAKRKQIIVPTKNAVDVKITSYLAYTADGRRQAMKDLASFPQMANLPPDVILKAYNVGPIADIVKQMLQEEKRQQQAQQQQQQQEQQQQTQGKMQLNEQQNQQKQQAMMQQQQAQQQQSQAQAAQQAQMQQQNTPPDMGVHQAIAFIRQLIKAVDEGHTIPKLPKKITPTFIQYLVHFISSPEAQGDPQLIQVLEMIKDRAILEMQGGGQSVQAQA